MKSDPCQIVILGLSITSSWGNGHATTYRGLVRALTQRGHEVLFLERDVPWYASARDLPDPGFCHLGLYRSREELQERFAASVREADLVLVGSYVPEGVETADWALRTARGATAFYDIDTPVTLAKLERDEFEYLTPELIPRFDAYLSFSGGPILRRIEQQYGSPMARALYCSFDETLYGPEERAPCWDLGYLGTYSDDRQPPLDRLLTEAAQRCPDGRFVVAGPQYPESLEWPVNVQRIPHLPPGEHREFYNRQRFTLNITRADMIRAGYSPSVRLFEAAACGVPVISDSWPGLETFFIPGEEILISRSADETLSYLRELPDERRREIGTRARSRVLSAHTAARRAEELEGYLQEIRDRQPAAPVPETALK